MININNLCLFEGRLTKDPKVENVNIGNKQLTKVYITIAVKRLLTKEQKENNAQDTDFINLTAFGYNADFISKYFKKGSGIKLLASYRSFQRTDSYGNVTYGNSLYIEQADFTTSSPSNNNSNNNFNNSFDDFNEGMDNDYGDMPF